MMLPARTNSPPNFFTPLRWPALSRPFRELPPAFLCAITFLQYPGRPWFEGQSRPPGPHQPPISTLREVAILAGAPSAPARVLFDIFYAHSRVRLPVSLSFPIIFAAFVLDNDNFAQPPLPD